MAQDEYAFGDAGTRGDSSESEVRKNGRVIGRILYVAESQHVSGIYQFHQGPSSIDLNAAAHYSDLDELKKWIRETQ